MKSCAKHTYKILLLCALIFTSPFAFAATGTIPWTGWLIIITTISLIAAIILSKRNKSAEETPVKILFGGLYFWVATFVQLTALSLVYYVVQLE